MKSRRELLAASALALPAVALAARGQTLPDEAAHPPCKRPGVGPMAPYFPNVVVLTHRNEKALFYDDLLYGKIVTINFFSTRDELSHEVTRTLVGVQKLLGDRMGDDVFFYSITTDPVHDTPAVLKAFAERHGIGPGWLLVTGDPPAMETLLSHIFIDPRRQPVGAHAGPHCSRGLVRYGNTVTGSFGSFASSYSPDYIAQRFSWVGFRRGDTKVAS